MWHFDFLEWLEGCEPFTPARGIAFKGTTTKPKGVRVAGQVGFSGHPMIEHFRFLAAHTKGATPKMTIPSPSVPHFSRWQKSDQRGRVPGPE
jgi:5-methyltetrahydropteroyltriglutamate--homocysteine methyltransferase